MLALKNMLIEGKIKYVKLLPKNLCTTTDIKRHTYQLQQTTRYSNFCPLVTFLPLAKARVKFSMLTTV